MTQPQSPDLRRSDKGATSQDAAESVAGETLPGSAGRPHGTDKGSKGGGEGGGVPPDQQAPYPS